MVRIDFQELMQFFITSLQVFKPNLWGFITLPHVQWHLPFFLRDVIFQRKCNVA